MRWNVVQTRKEGRQKKSGIALGILFLAVALVLFQLTASVNAQGNPTATPVPPTANPTIVALENVIATQQVRISDLEHQQKRKLEDLSFEVTKQLYYVSGIAAAFVLIVAFFGWRTYNDIDRMVKEKVKSSISKELEKQLSEADLTLIPVRVREGRNLEPVMQRLRLYGLKNLSYFSFFSKSCLRGITIVPIENKEDEEEFRKFISEYEKELNPQRAAFILYTGSYRVSSETVGSFPNLTLANMPATVGIAVVNIGKTLRNSKEEIP